MITIHWVWFVVILISTLLSLYLMYILLSNKLLKIIIESYSNWIDISYVDTVINSIDETLSEYNMTESFIYEYPVIPSLWYIPAFVEKLDAICDKYDLVYTKELNSSEIVSIISFYIINEVQDGDKIEEA